MSWRTKSSLEWLGGLPSVTEREALATRTSFGIGGPADFFIEAGRADVIGAMLLYRTHRLGVNLADVR